MKVKYRVNKKIYEALMNIFNETKRIEDDLDLAKIYYTENEIIYLTCCGNKWIIGHYGDSYYFGYEGTREGFNRVQPFYNYYYGMPRFYLDYTSYPFMPHRLDSKELVICIDKKYLTEDVTEDDDGNDDVKHYTTLTNFDCYLLTRLLEYETTLDKTIVHPLDTVRILLADPSKAVVMRSHEPLMIIEYKNMYRKEKNN